MVHFVNRISTEWIGERRPVVYKIDTRTSQWQDHGDGLVMEGETVRLMADSAARPARRPGGHGV